MAASIARGRGPKRRRIRFGVRIQERPVETESQAGGDRPDLHAADLRDLEADPRRFADYWNRGLVLWELKRTDEAKADFRKFLAVERARHEDATRLAAAKRATAKKARKPAPPREEHHTDRITVGSTVRLRDGGSERGEVLSLTGTRAVVLFGGRLRTTVDVGKLSWLK